MTIDYPRKQSGMYILSKRDIESIADKVLSELQPEARRKPKPTDLESMAKQHLKLSVKERILSPDGQILGAMVFHDAVLNYRYMDESSEQELIKSGTVLLDASLNDPSQKGRKRFTLAHEMGHWILHRSYYGIPKKAAYLQKERRFITCRTSYIEKENRRGNTDYHWGEWQANAFAAALLMPTATFESAVKQVLGTGGFSLYCVPGYGDTFFTAVSGISEIYDVSKTAVALRLEQLGYVKNPYVYAEA